MRILVYLGKGGVGKTTVSSATAVRIARSGKRTLIVSTDIAHSLADALDVELGSSPVLVEPNLYAMEINILAEIRNHWSEFSGYFSSILSHDGVSEIVADELAILPGMEEMVSLKHIWEAAKSDKYDVLIVDAAPTGETMRLLAMPDAYTWYTDRIASWHLKTISFAYPLIQKLMPKKNIFKSMPEIAAHMKELYAILTNPERTSYRIVLNPENMVIKEALRAQTYLNLFGYTMDAVIVNKVLPTNSQDPYMQALAAQQKKYIVKIEHCFYPVPIFYVPHYESEVIGCERLEEMAKDIFGEKSPESVFYKGHRTHRIEKDNGKYHLKLYLPNVEINHVQMNIKGDELLIEVNNFRKNIVLPNVLVGRRTEGATYTDGSLDVVFK
jgi:arsenite-transporting ATPase